jgi:glycosyltransferase involved in cell wall biosynthesis
MNLFFINSIAASVWGGGEKWMLTTASGLQQRGHHCYCCGQPDSLFLQNCTQQGLTILPLKIGSDFGLKNILRLTGFFKQHHIDIIIANFNKDVRLAGSAKKLAGVPVLIARNGLPILRNSWIYRRTYKLFVDTILTNTQDIKDRYLSYGWLTDSFIRVIHNGIDIDQQIAFDRFSILHKYNLPDYRPIVGFFGRLVTQKQPDKFLEIAARILQRIPQARFILAGDGPLRQEILARAAQLQIDRQIHLLGAQREVMELYSICNLVLLTSRKEGLPNVVMEAMLAAKPVVAFAAGGVRELISAPALGCVVPVDDIETAAVKAIEILKSDALQQQTGQTARRHIIENFSVKKMIDSVEQLCSALSAKKQKPAG